MYIHYNRIVFSKFRMQMNWDDIRIFLAVVRKGSLTAAGIDVCMSASSVGRHIDELEHRLGAALFLRSQAGYAISDIGLEILADAERAESSVIDIIRKASSSTERLIGTVRVALPENFATHLILPKISQFIEKYPAISLEFVTNVRLANLTRREADIALRLIRPEIGSLVVSRIAQMATALYASSEYLAQNPFDPARRGKGYCVVGWDEMFEQLKASTWLNERLPQAKITIRTTTLQSQLAACIGGAGLSVLPCFMADLASNLICVMPPQEVFTQNIWLTMHHDLSKLLRVRAVANFLQETMQHNYNRLLRLNE